MPMRPSSRRAPEPRSGLPSETDVTAMPSTATNILALPLVQAVIDTGNNEDWVDTIQWLVDNGSSDPSTMPQLDLRGLEFQMEIRRMTADAEVIIEASTWEGTLGIGAPPNYGFLIIYVPLASVMQYKEPGSYVGDIIAIDPTAPFTRVCVQIELTIVQGVTR